MKIVLITEGGEDIGFGHITRCSSLYEAFELKRISPEFIVNGDSSVEDLLKGKNYKIFNWLEKREKLFNFIRNADIGIIDSYLAGRQLHKKISEMVKLAVYIDDNDELGYPKGIVINWTTTKNRLTDRKKEKAFYLIGSQYIPLRKEFWNAPPKRIRKELQNIVVIFGGSDTRNMTPRILMFLNKEYPALMKRVIIGKAFQNINVKEIETLRNDSVEIIYYPDARTIKKVMLNSDMAISAAGQTIYELARLGIPTIAINVADNQLVNIKKLDKHRFVYYAGSWKNEDVFRKIKSYIERLKEKKIRQDKYRLGRKIVDGKGSLRIRDYLLKGL